MTEKTKGWLKENLLQLIVIAMFSAFWVGYEADRQADVLWKKQESERIDKINDRQQVISQCVFSDPDTRDYLKDVIYEWIKMETRGGL